MVEFQLGDKTVYPAYGVAEVIGIEQREISGSAQRYYVLRVLGKEMTLMVPMKNVARNERPVTDRATMSTTLAITRARRPA